MLQTHDSIAGSIRCTRRNDPDGHGRLSGPASAALFIAANALVLWFSSWQKDIRPSLLTGLQLQQELDSIWYLQLREITQRKSGMRSRDRGWTCRDYFHYSLRQYSMKNEKGLTLPCPRFSTFILIKATTMKNLLPSVLDTDRLHTTLRTALFSKQVPWNNKLASSHTISPLSHQ